MRAGRRARTTIALSAVGQALLGIGAVVWPWAENEFTRPEPAFEVLMDVGTGVAVLFVLSVAAAPALEAVTVWPGRRWWPAAATAGSVCALYAVLTALACAVIVSTHTVRAYVSDPTGRLSEPVAQSRPGLGLWCAIGLGVVALAVHATPLLRSRPRKAPPLLPS